MGPRLSNYWNIYWILTRSLTIGEICGVFLQVLRVDTPGHEGGVSESRGRDPPGPRAGGGWRESRGVPDPPPVPGLP